ncbi:Sir2 family NAD-dependent protein deacetylase [Patulibacter sp.]|uniref:SIR2 family NAD-dependent protein deacylase n=1 Tax=Patulibacter sp. TaxID=1912859 RepID=UPI00272784B4|nr:Sir2 family NAD-dependent protein deacetylase [Patulibacter sp.]MDO9410707.1 Sir2 family NAD-dependent protein deacetylase [Patulibacter sp.]
MSTTTGTDGHDRLARLVADAGSVVALTGAGISVPSGIPDFRSPETGLWANVDPMTIAHVDVWRADPVRFWAYYGERFARLGGVQPNDAHRALAELERRGRLQAVLTQNIDGLHERAGSTDVVELHGSIAGCHCPACGAREPLKTVLRLIADADDGVPRCAVCAGVLKPDVVLFGDMLPVDAEYRSRSLAGTCDLLLCIGSSLQVWPVAGLPERTLEAGGAVAIVTASATPYDDAAAVRLGGDVVDELQGLLAALDRLGA